MSLTINLTEEPQVFTVNIGDAALTEHAARSSGVHGISVFGASLVASDDAVEARETLGFYETDNTWQGRNSFHGPVDYAGAAFIYDASSLASQKTALGITGSGVASGLSHAVNAASGFVTFSGNIGAASGTSLTLTGSLSADELNADIVHVAENLYASSASFDGIVEFGGESRFYGEAKFSENATFEWTVNFTEPVVADSTLTVGGQTELLAQLATNGSSAMTRDLTRELAMSYPARTAMRYTLHPQIPLQSGVNITATGSALNQSSAVTPALIQCGATLNSSIVMRIGSYLNLTPGQRSLVDFNRKLTVAATIGSAGGGTLCVTRCLWPVDLTYAGGDPTGKVVGWKQIGTNLYGVTHDGTTMRTTAAFSFPYQYYANVAIIGNGAGSFSFYVNGSLLGTLAGPTGTEFVNSPAIGLQAENKESGGNIYCVIQSLEMATYA